MGYRLMGAMHARLHHTSARLGRSRRDSSGSAGERGRARQRGQGTVEYVALILLIAVVLGAVVTVGRKMNDGGIANVIVNKLKGAIQTVGAQK